MDRKIMIVLNEAEAEIVKNALSAYACEFWRRAGKAEEAGNAERVKEYKEREEAGWRVHDKVKDAINGNY